MQAPRRLDKAGGCLLAGRDHAQPTVQAMLGAPPPGTCGRRAVPQPRPFHACAPLTSVKKPAIPAWHEPCSSPYFFLYSRWEKATREIMVIPGMGHALHLSRLHCCMCSLEGHQHTELPGSTDGSATNVHHGSILTCITGKARGLKLGGDIQYAAYGAAKRAVSQ